MRTASNFIDLIQFHEITKYWRHFWGLNPKGPNLSLEKERETFCVVLRSFLSHSCNDGKKNVRKSVMHVQSCCFDLI